jgi:hypothetical protein
VAWDAWRGVETSAVYSVPGIERDRAGLSESIMATANFSEHKDHRNGHAHSGGGESTSVDLGLALADKA